MREPYPALMVALKTDPSVYAWIQSLGYELIVSSAMDLRVFWFVALVTDLSISVVFIWSSMRDAFGGIFDTLSDSSLSSGR